MITRRRIAIQGSQMLFGGLVMPSLNRVLGAGTESSPSLDRPALTPEYLNAIDTIEGEPVSFGLNAAPIVPWRLQHPRPLATWPSDEHSIDYRHLNSSFNGDAFSISAEQLSRLFVANRFPVEVQRERILFGLRGCTVLNDMATNTSFVSTIHLHEEVPDHQNARCVIGVLSSNPVGIWATAASTVPGIDRVFEAANGGRPANLLPTGAHRYQVGVHGFSLGPRARWQPGAFIQESPVAVLRAHDEMTFDIPRQKWDAKGGIPSDNIHAAVRDTGAAGPPLFSSAGCQTLPGDYDAERTTPIGPYADFRSMAGLKSTLTFTDAARSATLDDGRRFLYVLLTGREARLATQPNSGALLRRLRFGSVGADVARLRTSLALPEGTAFDNVTMAAFISWQLDNLGVADGIVSPSLANQLKFTL